MNRADEITALRRALADYKSLAAKYEIRIRAVECRAEQLQGELDTARAQVDTLAEALREIIANTRCSGSGQCNSYGICAACTSESFARDALKAAGFEPEKAP